MDADIDPVKKKSTWYQPDSAFTAKSGKDEKETTAEVDVADIINSFTSDKDWKDTFTLKSVTVQCWGGTLSKVVGVTGSEDTRTDAKIPDYDASPITMTKQAAQSWCPNGTAQGMIPVTIDGITTGTTTYGEIKDKFKNITFNGIDFVKDSIGGSASDYTYCLYAQWGSGWSWTASDSVSLDSKTKWSLTSLAEEYQKQNKATLNDDDVLQVIGIQINMADNNNLPAGVAALNIDEKFTINPAGAAVESVKITQKNGSEVDPEYTYGETIPLKAAVTPAGADNVIWTSKTPDVATVDENGEVTLLKAGEAKITATAGGVSSSVTFTVKKKKLTVAPYVLTNIYVRDNKIEAAAKAVTANYALENVENVSLVKGTDYTVSEPQISADKKYYSITITLSDDASGEDVSTYNYHEYVIKNSSLRKGIKYYDIALRIYMGAVLKRVLKRDPSITPPATQTGIGDWDDLSGLLLPVSEEERIVNDLQDGTIDSIQQLIERFEEIDANYRQYQWAWTYKMVCDYYGISEITLEDANRIHEDYIKARRSWIAEIKKDAEKEYAMGDVEEEVFRNFVNSLNQEVDYEN